MWVGCLEQWTRALKGTTVNLCKARVNTGKKRLDNQVSSLFTLHFTGRLAYSCREPKIPLYHTFEVLSRVFCRHSEKEWAFGRRCVSDDLRVEELYADHQKGAVT